MLRFGAGTPNFTYGLFNENESLERLDEFVARKRAMGRIYDQLLDGADGIKRLPERTAYADTIYWVYGVVLDDDIPFDAEEAMRRLSQLGIGSRPFFWPMHEQPVFHKMGLFENEKHPVSERIARRGFYLPSGMALTAEEIAKSAEALKEILH